MTTDAQSPAAGDTVLPASTAADWLVGSAVLVVAPLLRELPLWVSAGYLAAVAWRFMHTHWRWREPGRWLRWVLALAAIFAVAKYYGTLLGREPGVSLLVLLTGLKLLELRSLRDAALAALLLLLIMLGGFLYDNSLLLGLYTMLAVVAVTSALVRLQHPELAPLAVARMAALLVAQAIPLMLVAYLLFPRLPDAIWGLQVSEHSATTGMSDSMQPGSISALNTSDEVVFRAYFEGPPPPNRLLYWRVLVFWDTDGRTWNEGPRMRARDLLRAPADTHRYRIVLEPNDKPWVPALDLPAPLFAPPELRQRAGFVFETPRARYERRAYDFVSFARYQTGPLDRIERERALRLPDHLSERVRQLAAGWRASTVSDAEVVRTALAYFHREPFVYTLTPPVLGRDPVDQFLFETRRGFCEHYAAAFVTLMRAAGIPARVVVGYQGGVYNDTGNYLIVRQADAHAWAEVWLPQAGWQRVDPTAAIAPSRIEYGIDGVRRLSLQGLPLDAAAEAVLRAIRLSWLHRAWFRTRLAWDYLNFSWYQWVGDYSLDRQKRFLEQIGLTHYSVPVMVLILMQLILLYALLQLRRRRPLRPRDIVRKHYERYCRHLERAGLPRRPEEGPVHYAERVRARYPQLAPAIERITEHYVRLRYGEPGPDDLRTLRRLVRGFRVAAR